MQNLTDAPPRPDSDRERWAWLVPGVTYLTVLVITGITAAVSYEHEYQLAYRNGQAQWVAALLPFTVDGMILAASAVLLWAGTRGIRYPLRPFAVLVVGIAATIAANLAAGLGHGWLGAAVSAWCGLALILISDIAMWLAGMLRSLASGTVTQPAAGHACPPPPVSLAEVLPLARAELQQRGEPAGELALADRFMVTRNQVRKALAPTDPAGAAAVPSPAQPSRPATVAAANGSHSG